MWEKQNWRAAGRGVGRSSPRGSSVLPCPMNIAKAAVWNTHSCMEVVQNPSSFKQSIKDPDWLDPFSKVLLWPRSLGHLPQWPPLGSFATLTAKPQDRCWNYRQISKTILESVYEYHLIPISTKSAKWENAHVFSLPIFSFFRFIVFCVQLFEHFFMRV